LDLTSDEQSSLHLPGQHFSISALQRSSTSFKTVLIFFLINLLFFYQPMMAGVVFSAEVSWKL